ncbi:hypothetical protein BV22DRAFT_1104156 [Leucogyrophana mollusca]|uniref:Uncharacterized protein n=1 Tax=Leucogyrophana mollusca TaxID=85980 RepID=A0ACB8BMT5_9AGAM|nr:hypothetical protein BV22DRAFT_1104156 [Leucogyrophana mollusca]
MPSLRRSFSSPSVRSSPYPAALSNSSASGRVRVNEHGSRRSSGSETSERRVLAEIEWWRVTDSQREIAPTQDEEERDQDDDQAQDVGVHAHTGGVVTLSGDGSAERPQTPPLPSLHSHHIFGSLQTLIPTNEFAALSIAPTTPMRRRHGRDSSFSSLESTPEASETPLEGLHFSLADADPVTSTFPSFSRPSSHSPSALFNLRSYSFAGFDFAQRNHSGELDQFSDLGGSSFSLDRNLFH